MKEKLPMIPLLASENLKERQLRSARPISLGYWYSMMYQRPMNFFRSRSGLASEIGHWMFALFSA